MARQCCVKVWEHEQDMRLILQEERKFNVLRGEFLRRADDFKARVKRVYKTLNVLWFSARAMAPGDKRRPMCADVVARVSIGWFYHEDGMRKDMDGLSVLSHHAPNIPLRALLLRMLARVSKNDARFKAEAMWDKDCFDKLNNAFKEIVPRVMRLLESDSMLRYYVYFERAVKHLVLEERSLAEFFRDTMGGDPEDFSVEGRLPAQPRPPHEIAFGGVAQLISSGFLDRVRPEPEVLDLSGGQPAGGPEVGCNATEDVKPDVASFDELPRLLQTTIGEAPDTIAMAIERVVAKFSRMDEPECVDLTASPPPPPPAKSPALPASRKRALKTEPSQVGTKPSQVGTKPPQVGTKSSQVGIKPFKIKIKPSEVETKQSLVQTNPSEVETKQSQVQTKPSQVETKQSQVQTKPSQVETKQSQVQTKPSQVGIKPFQVKIKPPEVGIKPSLVQTKPSEVGIKPSQVGTKPSTTGTAPARRLALAKVRVKDNAVKATPQPAPVILASKRSMPTPKPNPPVLTLDADPPVATPDPQDIAEIPSESEKAATVAPSHDVLRPSAQRFLCVRAQQKSTGAGESAANQLRLGFTGGEASQNGKGPLFERFYRPDGPGEHQRSQLKSRFEEDAAKTGAGGVVNGCGRTCGPRGSVKCTGHLVPVRQRGDAAKNEAPTSTAFEVDENVVRGANGMAAKKILKIDNKASELIDTVGAGKVVESFVKPSPVNFASFKKPSTRRRFVPNGRQPFKEIVPTPLKTIERDAAKASADDAIFKKPAPRTASGGYRFKPYKLELQMSGNEGVTPKVLGKAATAVPAAGVARETATVVKKYDFRSRAREQREGQQSGGAKPEDQRCSESIIKVREDLTQGTK